MIIVLDTNIWLSQLGLGSQVGSAVRFYIRQQGARLVVPEVVKLEVEHNVRKVLKEHAEQIRAHHRLLLTLFGQLPEVVLPTDDKIERRAQALIEDVGLHVEFIPFTLSSARRSLEKVVLGMPPSGPKNQQFKDGVVWADCCDLLAQDSVYLISNDRGFYKNGSYEAGLARSLQGEIESLPHRLHLFQSLEDLLPTLHLEIPLDDEALVAAFLEGHAQSMTAFLDRDGFTLGEPTRVGKSLFATEHPEELFIRFTVEFECSDSTDTGRIDAFLVAEGEGTYKPLTREFSRLRSHGEKLSYTAPDGEGKVSRRVVAALGSAVVGHRFVSHEVRYPIGGSAEDASP
jgi:hypothetical protein